MGPAWSRRGLLQALAAAGSASGLAACGFQPIYMTTASGKAGPAARELAQVSVNLIPERPGQLLRQELQRRFGSDAGGVTSYDLAVAYSIAGEGIAVFSDTAATRIRFVAQANWTLLSHGSPAKTLTSGGARAYDAMNVIDQQYFAADLETETIQRRLAGRVADQIATQLAVYFRRSAASG